MNRDRPIIFVKLVSPQKKELPRFDWNTYAPLPPRQASVSVPLDISDKIISLNFEDVDDKADKLKMTIDNHDLSEFDNPAWRKGGILEVCWGFVGNMGPVRRVVIEKVSGNQQLTIEANGLEMLMHKAKTLKVFKGKTLYEIAQELISKYAPVMAKRDKLELNRVEATKAAEAKFPEFYKSLASRYNLDKNPENKRHFYDFKALHADVMAGKTKLDGKTLPPAYRRGAPSMWVRDQDGNLIDAKSGRAITDAEVEKVASTTSSADYSFAGGGHEDSDAGMSISNDARQIKIAYAAQSAQSDAQVLSKLARRHGYRFYFDYDKGFKFVPVGSVYKQKPAKTLTWFHGDGEWVSFNYETDSADKPKKVKERGINPLTKGQFEQQGSNADTQRPGLGAHIDQLNINGTTGEHKVTQATAPPAMTTEAAKKEPGFLDKMREWGAKAAGLESGSTKPFEAEDVAPATSGDPAQVKSKVDGKYKKRQNAAHQLSGTVLGDPNFRAKTLLQVEGIGRRLSGKWEVRSVEHTVDSSGYLCSFKAERDADNGYGEKGEKNSKASLNKQEAPKKDVNGEKNGDRMYIDGRTGAVNVTRGNPQGTQQ